jgi:hypothetical protein
VIGGDVKPFCTSLLEAREHVRHPAPVLRIGCFQMMNCRGHASLSRDAEDLVQARIDLIGLGALVRDVRAAVTTSDAGERDQLLG